MPTEPIGQIAQQLLWACCTVGFTPIFFARDRSVAKLLAEAGADVHFSKNKCAYGCRVLLW